MHQTVLVLNLPYVLNKNLNQVIALKDYHFIFITKIRKLSDDDLPPNARQIVIQSPLLRFIYVSFLLLTHLRKINHVEVYPGGILSFPFVLLGKLFQYKVVLAERGDIGCLSNYSKLLQWSMRYSYHYAHTVWYREPFMKKELSKLGISNLFFQGNAIYFDHKNSNSSSKTLDFLWVNRVIPERNVRWFVDILAQKEMSHVSSAILGVQEMLKDTLIVDEQKYIYSKKINHLQILGFENPHPFYKNYKFFVFPAEKTYANFSLLESMSYGLVPIVSAVPGTDLIVKDGENGIVFPFTKEGLEEGMKRALALSEEEYARLSKNARLTIETQFSLESYSENMTTFYESLTVRNQ